MAISVGSVEVDVVPNTRGIYTRLRAGLVPAGTRAGEDAGNAAGRAFGPAMQSEVGNVGTAIGQQIGRQIASRISAEVRDSLREGVTRGGAAARPAATRQGSETGGAFARAARARIEAAFRSLPDIDIDADTTAAQAEILRLRAQLVQLADQEIGVDLDAATALARIQQIQARLQALAASDADVQVRVDAAAAMAQLTAVQAMVTALDGRTAHVNVSTRQAVRAVLILTAAIGGLVAIPAVPVLAAGIGSIAAAATAAGAGVGALGAVAVPAFLDIGNALKAQKAAQDAATTASLKGGQAASTAARQGLQLASAQQALVTAHRNAARQIAAARQAVADAVQQSADRQRAAAEQVEDAEDSLADAQRSALQAQRDLTQARRDAAADLVDLGNRLASSRLSERDAVLDVQDAQARLTAVQATGSKATVLEQQRAQLAYDQAVQRLKEQQLETKRTAAEKKAADKAGVDGSDRVRSAQQRLADAQRTVRERAEGLADAQRESARAQVQGLRDVTRAQEQLAAAQQSAADSIAAAQQQIRSAQLSAAGGADQAAIAQAKYRAALAAMTPETRATFNAFNRLSGAFKDWSRELQPDVMPIFTRALNGLRKSLPGLTPFVREATKAIGDLQDRASRGFRSAGWQEFKKDLAGSVRPAIVGLGVAIGNIGKGLGGIIQAFLPHMDTIADRMTSITGRFADWGTSLKGSPAFEGFLRYSSEQAPILARSLGDVGRAFFEVARSLSPLSGPALQILGAMASGVASIAETLPWLVQGLYLVLIATKLWTLAMAIFNAVAAANPITLIIIGIVALVAAVIYAYKRFGWFRAGVQAAWRGIQIAAKYAWEKILKPTFEAIAAIVVWLWDKIIKPYVTFMIAYWRLVAGVVMWLWKKVFAPAFGAIGAVIAWWWRNVVKRYFTLVKFVFQTVGAVVFWFWKKVILIAFRAIRRIFSWWWAGVRLYFGLVKGAIQALGAVFRWLWRKVVKPVWDANVSIIKNAWRSGIRPAFDALKRAIGRVADAFRDAKNAIKTAWAKIKDATKKPINFVIDTVWNNGVVDIWKKIRGWIPGLPKLKTLPLLESGGMLPAQPGVFSRPAAIVGEGNPRHPEYVIPTDPKYRGRALDLWQAAGGQLMADGGILGAAGGLLGSAKDIGGKILGGIKGAADFLKDPVKNLAKLLNPLLNPLKEIDNTAFGAMVGALPRMVIDALKGAVAGSAGGGEKVAGALRWARTQAGKPYQWGGNGNPSWDCSGFLSAIESVIRGQNPHRRWSTHAFQGGAAPPGWKRGLKAPFQIGITHAGVGHTAGTLGGVNVESAGGVGVRVGPRARGAAHSMFSSRYGFAPSIGGGSVKGVAGAKSAAQEMLGRFGWDRGQWPPLDKLWTRESGWRWNARNPSSGAYGIPQSLPASKMASAGADWRTNPVTQMRWGMGYIKGRYRSPSGAWAHSQRVGWYDQGGMLPPNSFGYNGLSTPEAVLTRKQFRAMEGAAALGVAGGDSPSVTYNVYPRKSVIDRNDLRLMQRQDEALLRQGRPR